MRGLFRPLLKIIPKAALCLVFFLSLTAVVQGGESQQSREEFEKNPSVESAKALAKVFADSGQFDLGHRYFKAHPNRHKGETNRALGDFGQAFLYRSQSQWEKAVAHFQSAQVIFARVGNKSSEAICHHGIGVIFYQTDEYRKALTAFEASLELRKALGEQEEVVAPSSPRRASGHFFPGAATRPIFFRRAWGLTNRW